jgi:acetyl esterase
MVKWLLRIVVGIIALAGVLFIAAQLSPWPGALFIRFIFDRGSAAASAALEKHVPPGITSTLAVPYDPQDGHALLDVYYPANLQGAQNKPVVVWTHGGGFVSGRRSDVANYLKVISGQGFITISVDYTISPERTYPTPVRELNAALGYLADHGDELKLGNRGFVLAGDSAGAQISAQAAAIITSPDYATAVGIVPTFKPDIIKGLVLFCGPYDLGAVNTDGPFGWFLNTVMWSYSGSKDAKNNQAFQLMSVRNHVTAQFPPAFISAGNADPLLPQSQALAEKLKSLGADVDTLFFAQDTTPPLGHEYQFDLDHEPGQTALARTVAFLQRLAALP